MNPEKSSDVPVAAATHIAPHAASILVVDDTAANLQVLAGMLKERGYKVRPVPSGKLALLAAQREPPDLILLDINMPEMNGYEVCERLKADAVLAGVPVIFISALTEPLDKVKAFAAGGVDYITKPFQMEELHARVETHLRLRRQQTELEEYSLYLELARERLKLEMKVARGLQRSVMASSRCQLDVARDELKVLRAANADAVEAGEAERSKRAESERLGRAKDDFLANLSHEIRTPLNAILGWAHLLKPGTTSQEEMVHGLAVITRNARAQARLIEDLFDMSGIAAGKLRLDLVRVDLPALIEAAIETVKPAAEAKGMKVERVIDPIAGPVTGDPYRLQQVVWNLLTNAIKFTPAGGTVHVVLERAGACAEISVSDNGKGIDANFLPYVFERFRQADDSMAKTSGGLGLGLAIVKSLTELHGGTVRVTSDGAGSGATFIVSLPIGVVPVLAAREGPVVALVDGRTSPAMTPDLKGIKVMVVDDEADAVSFVRRMLEDRGATVNTCISGAECLDSFAEVRPDVLVMDVGMPELDGYAVMERLRRRTAQEGGRTPAVSLTAFARPDDRRAAMLAGFDVHVSKPVEPEELVALIRKLGRKE